MFAPSILALALQAATPCNCPADNAVVIGHRGSGASSAANPFAENTVPSVANAFEEGADLAEIDVHLSKDGKVVLLHDFSLDKTTDLTGCVANYEYAVLATADATVGSGAKEKVGVPLLSEILTVVKEHGRKLNIELKVQEEAKACPATDIKALAAAVVREVENAGMPDAVVFSSFSFAILEAAKALNNSIPVALLTAEGGTVLQAQAADAKAAGFEGINPIYVAVSTDEEGLAALVETGLQVSPWTVDNQGTMTTLITSGVHGVITDDVPAALAAREAAKAGCTCATEPVEKNAEDSGGCRSTAAGTGSGWLLALFVLAGLAGRHLVRVR